MGHAQRRRAHHRRRESIRQAQLARQQANEHPRYALAPVSPTSWSPFDYLKQFYAGCCAFLGVDESHNTRGDNSDIARAIARAKRASQSVCYASGTHYAGSLELFCRYWFRFVPDFWLRLGYTWKDSTKAIEDYGFAMYTTREVPASDRSRSGLSDYRTSKTSAPGISSRLLPELLSEIVYIDILDVAALCRRCSSTPRSSAWPTTNCARASPERDVGARLMHILAQHNPWKLPDTVDAEDGV